VKHFTGTDRGGGQWGTSKSCSQQCPSPIVSGFFLNAFAFQLQKMAPPYTKDGENIDNHKEENYHSNPVTLQKLLLIFW
jgi:hypothetical protein